MSQQITNNLPDKFGSSDEDEDDEEGNWIGEYGADSDFERRRAAAAANTLEDPFGNHHAMDFDDSDDDDGVDEEAWNSPVSVDWMSPLLIRVTLFGSDGTAC